MTADREQLAALIEMWRGAVDDFVALARGLDEAALARPTDLPGWNVKALVSHVAHLESDLAGDPQPQVEVPPAAHVTGPLNIYTESGVIARADRTLGELVAEIESAAGRRYAALCADPPTDGTADPGGLATLMGWGWQTLLRNRPLDVWMHEQDIRRAVGTPGGLDSAAARHTAEVYAASLPYVVGKKVAPPAGTTVALEVDGRRFAATVGENGRGAPVDPDTTDPDVTLAMDFPTWIILVGGRRAPEQVTVEITGDQELGRRVLPELAVTL
ncbi:MAG: maleylpyruvate isomerase family mycothiol-dependent enzyme [Micromonosporaceae bacterium]